MQRVAAPWRDRRGLDSVFDYTLLISGPAVSQLAAGCAPSEYTGPKPTLCPSIPDPLYALPSVVNGMENTTTCGCTTPGCVAPADMAKWQTDGIVSAGATYTYPKTAMLNLGLVASRAIAGTPILQAWIKGSGTP